MLLSLIFGGLMTCILSLWGSSCMSLVLICLFSLICMGQYFSCEVNMLFLSSSASGILIFLSAILCFLSLLATPSEKSKGYLLCIGSLSVFLFLAFSMSNVVLFYIFFECSLIPTLMLIIGWGYQPERLQAGTYMMLYTVGASLPLLALLLWRCWESCTMNLSLMHLLEDYVGGLTLFVIYGAFLVKLPMYSVHLWLPKAHVEAPLAGSMILAGILLKLGGFGLLQMNKCFSLSSSSNWVAFLVCLSVWGSLLAMFSCMQESDVKALVAYSSVGHMGIVSAGILLDRTWGLASAFITMVAHGFCSSALFCLAYFSYEKAHSRSLNYMKGGLQLYPILSFWWFLFCCINMAAPPSLNLVGELLIVSSLWFTCSFLVIVMGIMVFFSAAYNMFLYSAINHGAAPSYLTSGTSMRSFEKLSGLAHLAPFLIIFKSSLFMF